MSSNNKLVRCRQQQMQTFAKNSDSDRFFNLMNCRADLGVQIYRCIFQSSCLSKLSVLDRRVASSLARLRMIMKAARALVSRY